MRARLTFQLWKERLRNAKNYWVFGLFPSSGILENRQHDVSENGSVPQVKGGEDTYSVGALRKS
jgi:hypothetical protein